MSMLALFDLADFEAPPVINAPVAYKSWTYSCGRHEIGIGWIAHFEECWQGVCPSCGDGVPNEFLGNLNHVDSARQGVPCGWQVNVSNHLIWDARALDGEAEWVRSGCSAHGHLGPFGHEKHQWRKKPYPLECSAVGYGWKASRLIGAGFPVADLATPRTEKGQSLVLKFAEQLGFAVPNFEGVAA